MYVLISKQGGVHGMGVVGIVCVVHVGGHDFEQGKVRCYVHVLKESMSCLRPEAPAARTHQRPCQLWRQQEALLLEHQVLHATRSTNGTSQHTGLRPLRCVQMPPLLLGLLACG